MLQRGRGSSSGAFYAGRGIGVCDRWQSFESFLADMGPRPPGFTLERIDNEGHYEPGNCRWADRVDQANNTRRTRRIEYRGESLTLREWAARTQIPKNRLYDRLRMGWPTERILSA